ncbi:hypothetical protein BVRB_4g077750 [Beta vulgaris subsp. vulgaris]|nr:hypothetical protein BVRB_4g077750 [Beta vulgaris subsp. vulgaris]
MNGIKNSLCQKSRDLNIEIFCISAIKYNSKRLVLAGNAFAHLTLSFVAQSLWLD